MIEMVVFDMAGTVLDERNVVYKTMHQTLQEAGIAIPFETVLLHCAGKEKRQAFIELMRVLTGTTETTQADQLYQAFRDNLVKAYRHLNVSAQPGTAELFDFLKRNGILIVLNTGYDRATAEDLLEKLDWQVGEDIDFLVTASDVPFSRPAPDMIQYAMSRFKVNHPYYVIKVGDSMIDIEEGRNADCRYVVGITTGAHTRRQLMEAGPTHVIDNLTELRAIIEKGDAH